MRPLYFHHNLAAGKLASIDSNKTLSTIIMPLMWDNVTEIKSIIFGSVYGSKMRNVSRCRPTVSHETILATKQKFFFTKVAPVKSMTDIIPLGF